MAGYVLHLKEEESVTLSAATLRRLIGGGNGDAALHALELARQHLKEFYNGSGGAGAA